MKLPPETKPAVLGAIAGATVVAIAGFSWAGWVTAGSADAMAVKRADDAVVAALAPVCAYRFERDSEVITNRAALKAADSWARSDYVEKGGWAAIEKDADGTRLSAVARACATLLMPS